MEIVIGNVPYILTSFGTYVRLDSVERAYINEGIVRVFTGGSIVDLTAPLSQIEAEEKLQEVIDAQYKYAPVVRLVVRYDYSGVMKIYEGTHTLIKASVDDPNWSIKKFTYSGVNCVMEQGPLIGVWSNRTQLGW
jgi:hypothetical protein